MDAPEVRYARRRGLHIAYQIWGDGDRDILDFGWGTYISMDETAEQLQWRRYTERLAGWGRVIQFDAGAIGLSDTPTDPADLTYENWVLDAVSVADEVASTRVIVLAGSSSSLPALLFAAEYPERTESLILVNGTARYLQGDDYPFGIPADLMDEFRAGLDLDRPDEGSEDLSDLRLFAPSMADDPEFARWWDRASRAAPRR